MFLEFVKMNPINHFPISNEFPKGISKMIDIRNDPLIAVQLRNPE